MTAPDATAPTSVAAWIDVLDVLVDPADRTPLSVDGDRLIGGSGRSFEIRDGCPVLLTGGPRDADGWTFTAVDAGQQQGIRAPGRRRRGLRSRWKRWTGAGAEAAAATSTILAEPSSGPRRRVLIVGGGTIGVGADGLTAAPDTDVISLDVFASAVTTVIADGHQLPIADASIDAVWIQAVLEHVVQPSVVVAEIERVLRPAGVVYAETPFLQPVHEGAFDFTRFSHSGHRLLFAGFDEIRSGPLGGPGSALSLMIRGVVGGLTRRRSAGTVAGIATSWFAVLDRLVGHEWRVDYATGAFFLGRRHRCSPSAFDPESYYRGAQHERGLPCGSS